MSETEVRSDIPEELIRYVRNENQKICHILNREIPADSGSWPENRSCFWASKYIDGNEQYQGFTLYLFGGHALDIYVGYKKHITYRFFSDAYVCQTKDGKKTVRDRELDRIRRYYTGIRWTRREEVLKNGGLREAEWKTIITLFKKWAEGREPYKKVKNERMREGIIANANNTRTDADQGIHVFDMESAEQFEKYANETVLAKPDLMAVRFDTHRKTKTIISFEYKCTEAAVKGDYSFSGHYQKMKEYYNDPAYLKKMWTLYQNKCALEGVEEKEETESWSLQGEIAFLISHINPLEEECWGYVMKQTLLDELGKVPGNHEEIKLVVLEECGPLCAGQFLDFEKGIGTIRSFGDPGKDKNGVHSPWTEMYDRIEGEVPETEAEREAVRKLREGGSLEEAMKCSGLKEEAFLELLNRLEKRERQDVIGKKGVSG